MVGNEDPVVTSNFLWFTSLVKAPNPPGPPWQQHHSCPAILTELGSVIWGRRGWGSRAGLRWDLTLSLQTWLPYPPTKQTQGRSTDLSVSVQPCVYRARQQHVLHCVRELCVYSTWNNPVCTWGLPLWPLSSPAGAHPSLNKFQHPFLPHPWPHRDEARLPVSEQQPPNGKRTEVVSMAH